MWTGALNYFFYKLTDSHKRVYRTVGITLAACLEP